MSMFRRMQFESLNAMILVECGTEIGFQVDRCLSWLVGCPEAVKQGLCFFV